MNKKISLGALVGLLLASAPFAVSIASAQTTSAATTAAPTVTATVVSSQATIAQLQAQILQLTKQITELSARITNLRIAKNITTTPSSVTYTNAGSRIQKLMQQMQRGSHGEGVTMLQRLLSTDSTIYPSKLVTGYYGRLTEDAVRAFQKKNGIEDVGEVGPKTRSVLNAYLAHASSTMPSNLLREFEREGAARGSQSSVSVCQRNGQSGTSQTVTIAQSAVLAHIERGDSMGSCSSEGERAKKLEVKSENRSSEGTNKASHGETSSTQNTSSSESAGVGN